MHSSHRPTLQSYFGPHLNPWRLGSVRIGLKITIKPGAEANWEPCSAICSSVTPFTSLSLCCLVRKSSKHEAGNASEFLVELPELPAGKVAKGAGERLLLCAELRNEPLQIHVGNSPAWHSESPSRSIVQKSTPRPA